MARPRDPEDADAHCDTHRRVPQPEPLRRHGVVAPRGARPARRRTGAPDRGRRLHAVLGGDRPRRGDVGRATAGAVHERAGPGPRHRCRAGTAAGPTGADPHAHPHGSTGPHRLPHVDERLVQTGRDGGDGASSRRTQPAGRRDARGRRRRGGRLGRLQPRRRRAVPAAGHSLDPRPARGRLRAHADPDPGTVRRRGPRSATRREHPRGPDRDARRHVQLLHAAVG